MNNYKDAAASAQQDEREALSDSEIDILARQNGLDGPFLTASRSDYWRPFARTLLARAAQNKECKACELDVLRKLKSQGHIAKAINLINIENLKDAKRELYAAMHANVAISLPKDAVDTACLPEISDGQCDGCGADLGDAYCGGCLHDEKGKWLRGIKDDGYRTDNERCAAEILLKTYGESNIAPQQVQADAWRPIETAPKDGTRVLLKSPQGRIADGDWGRYGVWSWPYVMVEPTHWMPLNAIQQVQADAGAVDSARDAARLDYLGGIGPHQVREIALLAENEYCGDIRAAIHAAMSREQSGDDRD